MYLPHGRMDLVRFMLAMEYWICIQFTYKMDVLWLRVGHGIDSVDGCYLHDDFICDSRLYLLANVIYCICGSNGWLAAPVPRNLRIGLRRFSVFVLYLNRWARVATWRVASPVKAELD